MKSKKVIGSLIASNILFIVFNANAMEHDPNRENLRKICLLAAQQRCAVVKPASDREQIASPSGPSEEAETIEMKEFSVVDIDNSDLMESEITACRQLSESAQGEVAPDLETGNAPSFIVAVGGTDTHQDQGNQINQNQCIPLPDNINEIASIIGKMRSEYDRLRGKYGHLIAEKRYSIGQICDHFSRLRTVVGVGSCLVLLIGGSAYITAKCMNFDFAPTILKWAFIGEGILLGITNPTVLPRLVQIGIIKTRLKYLEYRMLTMQGNFLDFMDSSIPEAGIPPLPDFCPNVI